MDDESLIENLVESSIIYQGKLFNLRKNTVKLPNGKITDRDTLEHPGAVAIIPVIDDQIVLIRQFRQATGQILFEIPAGTLKNGEEPKNCATRELKEETGYLADSLTLLFHCYLAPGYSTEILYVFLATDLKQVGCETDPEEFIDVLIVKREKALRMIYSNEIKNAKTICGILTLQQLSPIQS